MSKYLIIVESPAKAKTIEKFLGKNYKVVASIGHIRDLPKSKMGVDIEDDFEPKYINIRGKGPIIKNIKKEANKHEKIYLATDQDREGEAIAWHLAHILGLDLNENIRIVFNEITKEAIKNAVKSPRKIDLSLVDAQQARRILDRLVGYSISPLLWRKFRKGLSAGRVQSVATKMICDREKIINNFESKEFWKINVDLLSNNKNEINSILIKKLGKEIDINNEKEANDIEKDIENSDFIVNKVDKRVISRNPYFSYTTSSLQQDAANKLNFSTKKTMIIAQQLYEGIKLQTGLVGLITYMRTDSTRISEEAKHDVKKYIAESFGDEYVSYLKNNSKKNKNTQDAHEAIRPSSVLREPKTIKDFLSKDQFRLYELIWKRFVASQMAPSKFENIKALINCKEYVFKSVGSKLIFDGHLRVLKNGQMDKLLPDLTVGETLELKKVNKEQKFTQPPARYTEASLVKAMEENGIGRPSTYSPTISTILARGYAEKINKILMPTELGEIINEIMESYFSHIVQIDFSAKMESKFDAIEREHEEWKKIIRDFYGEFKELLDIAESDIEKVDLVETTDIDCVKCGSKMVIKHGKFGKFLACSNYPECTNTKAILKEIGVKCPMCETGQIVERRTKKYRIFYGCDTFPDCSFVSWNKPVNEFCSDCGSILVQKNNGPRQKLICSNKDCKFSK